MLKQIITIGIGTVLAILLQLVVSPLLTIGGTTINFCLAFIVAISLSSSEKPKIALAVLLGVIVDLTLGGPVGAFTLLFVLSNVLSVTLVANVSSSTLQEKCIIAFVVCAVINILNCVIVGLATPGLNLVLAFTSGALWSCLFDGIVSIVFLFVLSFFIQPQIPTSVWKTKY